jgi:zeaxanthin glucosyltransferase
MHFGIVTPPVAGHLHPFGALGREFIRRGHRVTVFHMPDLGPKVEAEGLEFVGIGETICPPGFLGDSLRRIGQLRGLGALRFTISQICRTTEMFLRDAPEAMRVAGVDALLVDQTEPAGGSIAEHLGIPFVTVCNALALNREPEVPPAFSPWRYKTGWAARLRNRAGYAMEDWTMQPVRGILSRFRQEWKLPQLGSDELFSKLAQISQQPEAFDFPRRELPACFHYVGPLRGPGLLQVPFPWERLDGRPLIYASLGSLQTGKPEIFRIFAEACAGLDVQLVIAHGGALKPCDAAALPGKPVVVAWAPQRELLARAALTISHAGLNTVLDSLSFGVPVIAVPITFEQPAIARRLEWRGAGRAMRLSRLTAAGLGREIENALGRGTYRDGALQVKRSIEQAGGVSRAADLLDRLLSGQLSGPEEWRDGRQIAD